MLEDLYVGMQVMITFNVSFTLLENLYIGVTLCKMPLVIEARDGLRIMML